MPSPESLIEMAQGPKAGKTGSKPESLASRPEKPPKTQEELRKALEKRFGTLVGDTKAELNTYDQRFKEGDFEDKEDEETGAGDKRKELAQSKITDLTNRVDKMKKTLDSKADLPQATPTIEVEYSFTNPKTHQIEHQETITLDIEKKTQEFLDFYKNTGIDLPRDFTETISDIWERNSTEIEQAIKENGFDDILLIPANIPLPELAEKMKMGNGYYFYQVSEDFSNVQSQNTDKPRVILYHHIDTLPEISQKTGLNIHLNITGADMEKLYKTNPNSYLNTLEDAIILERKHLEDTGKHLSSWKEKSAQWLPGSRAGARLVDSLWNPDIGRLYVNAADLDNQDENLGARPSRSFF